MEPAELIRVLEHHTKCTKTKVVASAKGGTKFRCRRRTAKGDSQEVIVTVNDAGPNAEPNHRYYCTAQSDDGKIVTGNTAASPADAIAIAHWQKLEV
jgi:hypothetical protein